MPEINLYNFSHKELVVLMIKEAGVREGKWMLSTTFGFTAGNFGPSDTEMSPGAVVGIQKIGIQRATPDTPAAMIVDAAEVNPKPASSGKK